MCTKTLLHESKKKDKNTIKKTSKNKLPTKGRGVTVIVKIMKKKLLKIIIIKKQEHK